MLVNNNIYSRTRLVRTWVKTYYFSFSRGYVLTEFYCIYKVIYSFTYRDFIPIRLKLFYSDFHAPKTMILYYVYGSCPNFIP